MAEKVAMFSSEIQSFLFNPLLMQTCYVPKPSYNSCNTFLHTQAQRSWIYSTVAQLLLALAALLQF